MSTVFKNGSVVRSHDAYGNWCRRTDTPWPLVLVVEPDGFRAEDSEIMYRTLADIYEHDTLIVRFTCVCGEEHSADLSTREYFKCPACKRRHYPILRLKTVQERAPRRPS